MMTLNEWLSTLHQTLPDNAPSREPVDMQAMAEETRERAKRGYHGGQGDPHNDMLAAIRRF